MSEGTCTKEISSSLTEELQKKSSAESSVQNNVSSSIVIESSEELTKIEETEDDSSSTNTTEVKKLVSLMPPKTKSPSSTQGTSAKKSSNSLYKGSVLSMRTASSDDLSLEVIPSEVELKDKENALPSKNILSSVIKNKLNTKTSDFAKYMLASESKESNDLICRICHGGESTDDLVTPCRCRGTVAVVHLKCLERWLRESSHSHCELCQHHYKIIRQPKYSIPKSILVFLRHPGHHLKEILVDLLAFSLYTPSAVASTYMLMMICESLMKNNLIVSGSLSSHIIAFSAVFGMAAIDFSYSSWLMSVLHKHYSAWRDWYRCHAEIRVILSNMKMKILRRKLLYEKASET